MEWLLTALFISRILKRHNIGYVVYGSGAALLHGVQFPQRFMPSDIDISTDNLSSTLQVLTKSMATSLFKVDTLSSSSVVKKLKVTLSERDEVALDCTYKSEFGLVNVRTNAKNDIIVISVVETLLSIFLRNPKRPKDLFAAIELMRLHYNELQETTELSSNTNQEFRAFVFDGMKVVQQYNGNIRSLKSPEEDKQKVKNPNLSENTLLKKNSSAYIETRLVNRKQNSPLPVQSVTPSLALLNFQGTRFPASKVIDYKARRQFIFGLENSYKALNNLVGQHTHSSDHVVRQVAAQIPMWLDYFESLIRLLQADMIALPDPEIDSSLTSEYRISRFG